MNVLIDALPQELGGKRIKSDFRNMVLFELMLQDPMVPDEYRVPLAIDYLYAEPVDDVESAIADLMWFHRCGEPQEAGSTGSTGSGGGTQRAYDFEQDALYIYAAFLSTYGVDLCEIEYLHWWKFQAMFRCLPEDTKMSQIMGYRLVDTSGMSGKEKAFYQRMKQFYRIKSVMRPDQLTLAAQEAKIKQHALDRFAAAETWLRQKEALSH